MSQNVTHFVAFLYGMGGSKFSKSTSLLRASSACPFMLVMLFYIMPSDLVLFPVTLGSHREEGGPCWDVGGHT
eukprot:1150051-Pelagomonas_calceolata.AAC.1